MPRDLLSKGERALLTLISAKISGLSGTTLAIDQGDIGLDSETLSAVLKGGKEPRSLLIAPKWVEARSDNPALASDAEVTLRDVERGPLQAESLTFDIGGLVMIKGGIGTGKSLLLDEIQRRFVKRRKLGHLASFGVLKKSFLVRATDSPAGVVCDLLGVEQEIAAEAARMRQAQERGLTEADFLLASSKHRCSGCKKGYNGLESRCPDCDGTLFDAHVATVLVNGVRYGDLMRQSLKEVSQSLWSNDVITSLLKELPETLLNSLSLGAPVSECDPSIRRFLSVFAALHVGRICQGDVRNALFLIDNPFGVAPSYQSLMLRCIRGLSREGATIVCAGVPEALESIFSSVIRLSVVGDTRWEGSHSRFFDTRMGRRVELCIDR
jgi:excinuclease UvrABC ATPase subunit